ncbi:MAG: hypothetical protein IIZ93_11380 [Acidaminococcaceae bacterium]|nr:hypothetical protein [Acidaminococcaceae bacterium]
MPIKIMIDPHKCAAKVEGAWQKGLFELTSQIMGDCNQYVKRDSGDLEGSSTIHTNLSTGEIIWDMPYAKRQYWEIKTSLTPGRTWKWCETAKRKHKEDWQRIAEKGMRDNL